MKKDKTLMDYVNEAIAECDRNIQECKEKMDADYLYNFEWGYVESRYTEAAKKRQLTRLQQFLEKEPERAEDWLKENREQLTEELINGRVIKTSTSAMSNHAHLLSRVVAQELIKTYKLWLRWLKDTEPLTVK